MNRKFNIGDVIQFFKNNSFYEVVGFDDEKERYTLEELRPINYTIDKLVLEYTGDITDAFFYQYFDMHRNWRKRDRKDLLLERMTGQNSVSFSQETDEEDEHPQEDTALIQECKSPTQLALGMAVEALKELYDDPCAMPGLSYWANGWHQKEMDRVTQQCTNVHSGHEVVDNIVAGKEFKYCRDCKEEV